MASAVCFVGASDKTKPITHYIKINLFNEGGKCLLSSTEFTMCRLMLLLPNRVTKFYSQVLNFIHLLPYMDSGFQIQSPLYHLSPLFQTELLRSSVAAALPNTSNSMGEAAEFDR